MELLTMIDVERRGERISRKLARSLIGPTGRGFSSPRGKSSKVLNFQFEEILGGGGESESARESLRRKLLEIFFRAPRTV